MSDEEKKEYSFIRIDAGGISKPFTALVEKSSAAIGKMYEPVHAVRQAKSKAEVARIEREMTAEEIRARNLSRAKELRNQRNIENTFGKARKELPPDTPEESVKNVSDDWIARVLNEIGMVSDEKMQMLWAKILAGEAVKSGSFSKRTVRVVADMSQEDAEMFMHFCEFAAGIPLVYKDNADYPDVYNKQFRMFETLEHLGAMGLITVDLNSSYFLRFRQDEISVDYHGRTARLSLPKDGSMHIFRAGSARFTEAGLQLLPICGATPNWEFWTHLLAKWKELGYNPVQTR